MLGPTKIWVSKHSGSPKKGGGGGGKGGFWGGGGGGEWTWSEGIVSARYSYFQTYTPVGLVGWGGWGGVGGWVEANNKAYSGLQLKACQLDRVWQNAYSHKEVTYLLQISKLLTMTMCQITGTSWSWAVPSSSQANAGFVIVCNLDN